MMIVSAIKLPLTKIVLAFGRLEVQPYRTAVYWLNCSVSAGLLTPVAPTVLVVEPALTTHAAETEKVLGLSDVTSVRVPLSVN